MVSWSSGAIQQGARRTACGGFTAVTPVAEHAGWIASRSAELRRSSPAPRCPAVTAATGWPAPAGAETHRP